MNVERRESCVEGDLAVFGEANLACSHEPSQLGNNQRRECTLEKYSGNNAQGMKTS